MNTARSSGLFERARAVLPGGNTRHTIWSDPHPIYAVRGSGCRIVDADGVERIDFVNNYASLIHGHARPEIVAAICGQAAALTAVGLPTECEIALAELLTDRLPAVEQVRFCNSGSEAVMLAIRVARAFTGRSKIAKIEGAYHGAYDCAEASLAPSPAQWGDELPVPVGTAAHTPAGILADVVILPFNDVERSRRALEAHSGEIAAILFDPVIARLGYLPATDAYLDFIRAVTGKGGPLLLLDEVLSFRLGFHGAQHRFGLDPHLTALGKIIGGGLPVGAVGGRRAVMAMFDGTGGQAPVPHGGTFNANPLTMAAGIAAMRLWTTSEIERLDLLAARLRDGIASICATLGIAAQPRAVGSLVSSGLRGAYSDYRSYRAADAAAPLQAQLHRALLERGILATPQLGFILSTATGDGEIDFALAQFEDALRLSARTRHANQPGISDA